MTHPDQTPVTVHQVLNECARELQQRRRFYPRRVEDGRMTQEEADYQTGIARAWHQDVQRIIAFEEEAARTWKDFLENSAVPRITEMSEPEHGFTWQQRREGLAREIGLRIRVYPQRVAEARMTEGEADHRLACFEALADRYDNGFDWRASNGESTHFGFVRSTPAIEQARREWDEHWRAVEAQRWRKAKEMAI